MKKFIITIFLSAILSSCSNQPEPIVFGEDVCTHCKMMITDEKYGSELVTDKGKIFKYDSIECMLEQLHNKTFSEQQIHSLWVIDFSNPKNFTDARQAYYTKNDEFRSPMGLNVQAFGDLSNFEIFFNDNGGEKLSWDELLKFAGTMH